MFSLAYVTSDYPVNMYNLLETLMEYAQKIIKANAFSLNAMVMAVKVEAIQNNMRFDLPIATSTIESLLRDIKQVSKADLEKALSNQEMNNLYATVNEIDICFQSNRV